jgi:hypothetical protein
MFRRFRRYRFYIPEGRFGGRIVTFRFGYRKPDEPGDTTCGFYERTVVAGRMSKLFWGNGHTFDEAICDLLQANPGARMVP